MNTLITGISSGLGKFLYENIENSMGLDRENFNLIKNGKYDVIIHCAFNKENDISDHKKYLEDNIFLTKRLKQLNCKKFIYISSIDVYKKDLSMYANFKKFAESLLDPQDLCIRCSMIIGKTMKENHLTKILKDFKKINLSSDSTFNYILMDDLLNFFKSEDHLKYSGFIDFVSNSNISLNEIGELFNSKTIFGDFKYHTPFNFENPIYNLDERYNISSLENIKKYFT